MIWPCWEPDLPHLEPLRKAHWLSCSMKSGASCLGQKSPGRQWWLFLFEMAIKHWKCIMREITYDSVPLSPRPLLFLWEKLKAFSLIALEQSQGWGKPTKREASSPWWGPADSLLETVPLLLLLSFLQVTKPDRVWWENLGGNIPCSNEDPAHLPLFDR